MSSSIPWLCFCFASLCIYISVPSTHAIPSVILLSHLFLALHWHGSKPFYFSALIFMQTVLEVPLRYSAVAGVCKHFIRFCFARAGLTLANIFLQRQASLIPSKCRFATTLPAWQKYKNNHKSDPKSSVSLSFHYHFFKIWSVQNMSVAPPSSRVAHLRNTFWFLKRKKPSLSLNMAWQRLHCFRRWSLPPFHSPIPVFRSTLERKAMDGGVVVLKTDTVWRRQRRGMRC